jgi:transcription elongation factor Elf1
MDETGRAGWPKPVSDSMPAVSEVPYPDYVTCPHCGEPEVEVWCYEKTARCHNCGRTFEHPVPPECQSECDVCDPGLSEMPGSG